MLSWVLTPLTAFATYYNAQLLRFNSKFASPENSDVDTLAQDWSAENDWLCPPVHLIIDSVHLKSCSGRGTLVIPEWPSASFWPFLRERSSQFKSFVVDLFVVPAINDLLLEGPGQRQIYASRPSFFSRLPEVQNAGFALRF